MPFGKKKKDKEKKDVPLKVTGVRIHVNGNICIVKLHLENNGLVGLSINLFDSEIARGYIFRNQIKREFMYGFVKNFFERMDITIVRIQFVDIVDNIFRSTITVLTDKKITETFSIDASDAVLLSMATGAQMYVLESVYKKAKELDAKIKADFEKQRNICKAHNQIGEISKQAISDWVGKVTPSDFLKHYASDDENTD